jgi:antitoxin component YwqK of YwqJK toxin-antitoxin module
MNFSYKYLFINALLFFLGFTEISFAQDTLSGLQKQQYFYPNGKTSSEGSLKNGRPEGYWISYYENGKVKAEGNRKNFELDSLWKFYNEEGKLILEINYLKGKKNGLKTSYLDKEIIRENFKNDIKEGYTCYFYPDGKIKQDVPFIQGQEQGFGREYGIDGTIITLTEYKRGFIVDRLRINRKDGNGHRQGKWYIFYFNGKIRSEGSYKDDKKNGYFKEYTENGDLLTIAKYVDDLLQPEAQEIKKPDIRNEYYPNGKIKISAMFRNGIPDGLKRIYDSTGKIEKSYLYENGLVTGEGIVKEDGNKDGPWKEFYPDGDIKSEGNYDNGKQTGGWKYYHPNGKTEQEGKYNKQGKPEGRWKWYFDSGQLLKDESYHNGQRDGLSTTYDEAGIIVEDGEYVNGNEEGPWFEQIGDAYIKGTYRDGLRNGMWYYYYLDLNGEKRDSLCYFKGNFVKDNPDGKHVYFWDNGKVKDEGLYVMGKKEGDWVKYNYDGTLFMIITYKDGIEVRYDGIKIKPPFEKEEE